MPLRLDHPVEPYDDNIYKHQMMASGNNKGRHIGLPLHLYFFGESGQELRVVGGLGEPVQDTLRGLGGALGVGGNEIGHAAPNSKEYYGIMTTVTVFVTWLLAS